MMLTPCSISLKAVPLIIDIVNNSVNNYDYN